MFLCRCTSSSPSWTAVRTLAGSCARRLAAARPAAAIAPPSPGVLSSRPPPLPRRFGHGVLGGPSRGRAGATAHGQQVAQQRPANSDGVVVVVGAGIIGLATAQELLRRGHRVAVIAKSTDPDTTTSIVAAGFVFPYLLKPISQCEKWVKRTLELCRSPPAPGLVQPMQAYALHIEHKAPGEPEWGTCGLEYRRMTATEIEDFNGAREDFWDVVDGFVIDTYCIDTGRYLNYLIEDIQARGEVLHSRTLSSLTELSDSSISDLIGGQVKAVVNCTGVYARQLVGDESVRPIYGQVLAVRPQAGVTSAYIVEDGTDLMGGSTYMFPRQDKIVCGGTAILDKWSEQPDPQITEDITDRVRRLAPEVQITGETLFGVRCGLRPSRPQLRLELEEGHDCGVPVVHSYGHGGSGWTVFVGAAEDAADLVERGCAAR